jgi:ribosomal protein L39E
MVESTSIKAKKQQEDVPVWEEIKDKKIEIHSYM